MKGIDKEHWIIYHMASKLYLPRKSTEDTENAHITSLKTDLVHINWLVGSEYSV